MTTAEEIGRRSLEVLSAQAAAKRRQGEKTVAAIRTVLECSPRLSASQVRAALPFPVSLRRVQQILKALRAIPSVFRAVV